MNGKRNKFLKNLLWIVVIILVVIVILQFVISGITKRAANKYLEGIGEIGKININLLNGSVSVSNITIIQPEGYQNEYLLKLGKLSAKINYLPLIRKKIVVSYVNVSNVEADIQKIDDDLNLMKIIDNFAGSTGVEEKEDSVNLYIYVKKVDLRNIALQYTEVSDSTGTQQVILEGLNSKIRKISSIGMKNLLEKVTLTINKTVVNISDIKNNKTHLIVHNFTTEVENILSDNDLLQILKIAISQDSLFFSNIVEQNFTKLSMRDFALEVNNLETFKEEISIEKIATDSFEVYADLPDSMKFHLSELNFLCNNVKVSNELNPTPTDITFTGKILNEELGDNLFGIYALVLPDLDNFPTIDAVLQVIGLELQPMKSLIPIGTYQALGGDAFDLSAQIITSDTTLNCEIDISMIQGSKLGMNIGGTPEKPELDSSSVLFNVFSRFGGGIGSGFSKLGGTTLGAAKTSLTTALGLGKGAANVVGSVGKGVFKSVKGVVTLDVGEIGEGLKTTTVGTVTKAGKTVLNTGENLLEGTGDAFGSATGKTAASDWRAEKQERWNELWEKAKDYIKK